jgi:uncharacterized protein (DUF983 family)
MFISPRYQLKEFDKMHDTCEVCGLKYDIEPGYYTGAYYVSYAFTVAIFVVSGFSLYFLFNDPDIMVYVFTTLILILLLLPMLFGYSRMIYLHLFGGIVPLNTGNNC